MNTSADSEVYRPQVLQLAKSVRRPSLSRMVTRYGYPLIALARRDFVRTYGRMSLGYWWMALHPALLLALYIVVFGFFLGVKVRPDSGPGDFAIYLVSGMLPYMALSDGIYRASASLAENRSLLDQGVFPAEVIPLAGVVSASLTEAVGLVIASIAACAIGKTVNVLLILLPVLLILRIVLTAGVSYLVSVLSVFIPDLKEMLGFLLTAWLFLTPIFYAATSVPEAMRVFFEVNPLYHVVAAYRSVLFAQPGVGIAILKAAASSAIIFTAGLWVFRKLLRRVRELI